MLRALQDVMMNLVMESLVLMAVILILAPATVMAEEAVAHKEYSLCHPVPTIRLVAVTYGKSL